MPLQKVIDTLSETTLFFLNIIQKNGPVTINQLVDQTGTSRGRLMRIVKLLEEKKLIIPCGYLESTGGRRSILYDVNCDDFFFVGFSIGSIRCSIHIINFKGQHVISRNFILTNVLSLADFQEKVDFLLKEMLTEKCIKRNQLVGIGIGLSGSVNRKEGFLLHSYLNSFHPTWLNSSIKKEFQAYFGLPIVLDSNIFGDALCEYYYKSGRESDRLLVVHCNMSVTSAFISKGQTFRDLNTYNDALAHMTINIDGRLCSCGNYGCVNMYSSVTGILEDFKSQIKIGSKTDINKDHNDINISDITLAAERGDFLSTHIVSQAGNILGCGLSNYIRLFNPDTVIVAGMLIDQSKLYYDNLLETTQKRLGIYGTNLNVRFIPEKASETIPFSEGGAILIIENILNPNEIQIPRFTLHNKL